MKILICGSRDWDDYNAVLYQLRQVVQEQEILLRDIDIIHGAARGADTIAHVICTLFGIREVAYPADWKTYGKAAGPIRNKQMLAEKPDIVLAFQINKSHGTQHMIDIARAAGIEVRVFTKEHEDE